MKLEKLAAFLIILFGGRCYGHPRASLQSRINGLWIISQVVCKGHVQIDPGAEAITSTLTLEIKSDRIIQRANSRICKGYVVRRYRIAGHKFLLDQGFEAVRCDNEPMHRRFVARKVEFFRLRDGVLTIRENGSGGICGPGKNRVYYTFRKVR